MSLIIAVGQTDIGNISKINEDSFQCMSRIYPDTLDQYEEKGGRSSRYKQVYSVSDGLGGPGLGDIAGRTIQSLLYEMVSDLPEHDDPYFEFPHFIQEYVDKADQLLKIRLRRQPEVLAGCSLATLIVTGRRAYTMSIGSCRIYLYRRGELFQMTRDQRLNDDAGARPLIFLGNHPGSQRVLAQNLNQIELEQNDVFLILSDGISTVLQDIEIQAVLQSEQSFPNQVRMLLEQARSIDNRDNQTLLALKVQDVEKVETLWGTDAMAMALDHPQNQVDLPLIGPQSGSDFDDEHEQEQVQSLPSETQSAIQDNSKIASSDRKRKEISAWTLFLICLFIGIGIGVLLLLFFRFLLF